MSKTRSTARSTINNRGALDKSGLSKALGRIIFEALTRADEGNGDVRLTVVRAPSPVAPAHLTRLYPGDTIARAPVRAMYESCLRTYREAIRPQDEPLGVDDAGAALAYFVAASLFALHGTGATREILERLGRQLRGVARTSSAWVSASIAERQHYFETLATLGVLLAGKAEHAKSQGPAAIAEVKRAARGYLIELLGIDPDLLLLDETGLSLRSNDAPRAAA